MDLGPPVLLRGRFAADHGVPTYSQRDSRCRRSADTTGWSRTVRSVPASRTSSCARSSHPAAARSRAPRAPPRARRARRSQTGSASLPLRRRPLLGGMTVRRLAREADDGYGSPLVPGIRSGADAARLAEEIASASTRLEALAADPPGLYAEVAGDGPIEERTWLAVQIALLGPLQTGSEGGPFVVDRRRALELGVGRASGARRRRARPASGRRRGEGGAHRRGLSRLGRRAWARRRRAFRARPPGRPERRFDRVFERLGSLAAMNRDPRYDLLVTLGRLGVYELTRGPAACRRLRSRHARGQADPRHRRSDAARAPRR